jgi:hypothetical protein
MPPQGGYLPPAGYGPPSPVHGGYGQPMAPAPGYDLALVAAHLQQQGGYGEVLAQTAAQLHQQEQEIARQHLQLLQQLQHLAQSGQQLKMQQQQHQQQELAHVQRLVMHGGPEQQAHPGEQEQVTYAPVYKCVGMVPWVPQYKKEEQQQQQPQQQQQQQQQGWS